LATLHVKSDTYERLVVKAAAKNTTVDDFVGPVLEQLAGAEPPSAERDRFFELWMNVVQSRANRYPAGFEVDDSRESIYAGRGE